MLILSINVLFGQVGYNEEFKLSQTKGSNIHSEVALLSDDKFVLCWKNDRQNIVGQVFNNNFERIGNEFSIMNTWNDWGGFYNFDITSLKNGKIVICWGNKNSIYFSIINEIGEIALNKVLVDSACSNNDGPSVIEMNENNFLVTWTGERSGSYEICGKIYGDSGCIIKDEFYLNSGKKGAQTLQSSAKLKNGNIIICFWDNYEGNRIKYFIINSEGNSITNEYEIEISGYCYAKPKISVISDNRFVLCFVDEKIKINLINSDGNLLDKYYTLPRGAYPQIQSFNDDKIFIVTYDGYDEIIGYFIDINDESINYEEILINDISEGFQYKPNVTTLSDGKILVTWTSAGEIAAKYYLPKEQNHELKETNLITPAYDATLTTTTPYFKWNQAIEDRVNFPWEVYYDLYISKDENFTDPFVVYSITDTSYLLKEELKQQQLYYWKVLANTYYGDSLWSTQANGFYISAEAVSDIKEEPITTTEFSLQQNYPNPFNPSTMISYQLPMNSKVKLVVYNNLGKKVSTLVDENQQVGNYSVNWDATGLSSGIYFYRLVVGNPSTGSGQGYVETKKMIFLK